MYFPTLIVPVVLLVALLVPWLIIRSRSAIKLGKLADGLVFGGLGLSVLGSLVVFLFNSAILDPTFVAIPVGVVIALAGLIIGIASPKTAHSPRAQRPPSTRPFLAPTIWLVVGVVSGIAALITALVPVAGCPPLTSWAGGGYLERDYANFVAGHDCNGSEAVILAVAIVLGILGLAGVPAGVIMFAARAGRRPAPAPAPVAVSPAVPAGWFPATDRPGELRWWDGAAWTDHYHRPE